MSYDKQVVVSGVSAAEMVAALYNVAIPADLAQYREQPMTLEEAQALLDEHSGFPFGMDYIDGRPVKIRFDGHPRYSYENFERYNGEGVFTVVVKILQETHDVWHPVIQRLHHGGLRAMVFDSTFGGTFPQVQHTVACRHLWGIKYPNMEPLTLPEILGGNSIWK